MAKYNVQTVDTKKSLDIIYRKSERLELGKLMNAGKTMSLEKELQQKMDVEKWLESETRHFDMCGSYDYCAFCDKSEETPCANAYLRMTAQNDAQEAEPEPSYDYPVEGDTEEVLGRHIDPEIIMKKKAARKSLSFAEKYSLQSDIVKERYAALRAALTAVPKGTPRIKGRISRQCDTYRRSGVIVAKITIIGKSLRINLPLDPDAPEFCDGKTPHENTGHKKVYECVPFQFKVNSKLGLKRAIRLIELVK